MSERVSWISSRACNHVLCDYMQIMHNRVPLEYRREHVIMYCVIICRLCLVGKSLEYRREHVIMYCVIICRLCLVGKSLSVVVCMKSWIMCLRINYANREVSWMLLWSWCCVLICKLCLMGVSWMMLFEYHCEHAIMWLCDYMRSCDYSYTGCLFRHNGYSIIQFLTVKMYSSSTFLEVQSC